MAVAYHPTRIRTGRALPGWAAGRPSMGGGAGRRVAAVAPRRSALWQLLRSILFTAVVLAAGWAR